LRLFTSPRSLRGEVAFSRCMKKGRGATAGTLGAGAFQRFVPLIDFRRARTSAEMPSACVHKGARPLSLQKRTLAPISDEVRFVPIAVVFTRERSPNDSSFAPGSTA